MAIKPADAPVVAPTASAATPAEPAAPSANAGGEAVRTDREPSPAMARATLELTAPTIARQDTPPRATPATPAAPAAEAALLAASRMRVVVDAAPAQPSAVPPTAELPAAATGPMPTLELVQQQALNTPAPRRADLPSAAAAGGKTQAADAAPAATAHQETSNAAVTSVAASSGQNAPSSGDSGYGDQAAAAPVATGEGADVDQASLEQTAFESLVGEAVRSEAAAEARAATQARGAPDTVAQLASQIAKRLDGRSTRFEISLDPAGLGAVQVSVDINARGELSAHMSFERGETASDMRSRAAELQRALEQAGFDLSRGGLSFEQGSGRERGRHEAGRNPARAFEAGLQTADAADLGAAGGLHLDRHARSGVNVVI